MSDDKLKKVHRVQIDFSEDAYNKLLKLKEDAGAENISSVIKDALGLYKFWIEEKNEGAELLVRKNGEVEVLVITSGDPDETENSNSSESN